MERSANLVRRLALVVLCALVVSSSARNPIASAQQSRQCVPGGALGPLPGLPEASGLAVSQRTPGRLWRHNDSGAPVLFALDATGAVKGQVQVTGATVEDWEAIAVGPCETGSCVYVADIGDNRAGRRRVTIYRIPEPEPTSESAAVSGVFHAAYPDGAHDAEALLIADGRLYIVTKGETGPLAVYRFPAELQAGATMRLERVAAGPATPDRRSRITDGSVSPNGRWVVLRSRSALEFHRTPDLLAGRWQATSTVDVTPLGEPQGEGVALGADDTVFLAGEGGGKGRAGTFARFTCAPGPADSASR